MSHGSGTPSAEASKAVTDLQDSWCRTSRLLKSDQMRSSAGSRMLSFVWRTEKQESGVLFRCRQTAQPHRDEQTHQLHPRDVGLIGDIYAANLFRYRVHAYGKQRIYFKNAHVREYSPRANVGPSLAHEMCQEFKCTLYILGFIHRRFHLLRQVNHQAWSHVHHQGLQQLVYGGLWTDTMRRPYVVQGFDHGVRTKCLHRLLLAIYPEGRHPQSSAVHVVQHVM